MISKETERDGLAIVIRWKGVNKCKLCCFLRVNLNTSPNYRGHSEAKEGRSKTSNEKV
jgi:hypothetical protein